MPGTFTWQILLQLIYDYNDDDDEDDEEDDGVFQGLSGGLHLSEGWEKSKLRLHQLRHFWLGIPGSFQADDPGLLGKPLPAGQ